MARDIALYHHEKWDGSGYPHGLVGTRIPIAARIVALADVYDALTSRRVYRDAMTHMQAKTLILRERETHFDPDVVDAFLAVEKQFISVHERFHDDEREERSMQQTDATREKEAQRPRSTEGALVVDDDPLVRDMLQNFLNMHGMECMVCCDGGEALSLLEIYSPRLIISDWEMPGIDGLEFCRRVRSRVGADHIHFIMLTVHTGEEELTRAFDAGVDDFLAKPFNDAELMARIRTGMRAIGLYDELARQHRGSRQLNEQLTSFNKRLEKLAITDDLTGLYNRRQAMHRLEEHWALCERYQRPVAIVSLDIDHFKQINDVHGHAGGDTVLCQIADILRQCVRSTDTVCRIGGEEFLIVLPYQTQQEAEICAGAAVRRSPSIGSDSASRRFARPSARASRAVARTWPNARRFSWSPMRRCTRPSGPAATQSAAPAGIFLSALQPQFRDMATGAPPGPINPHFPCAAVAS